MTTWFSSLATLSLFKQKQKIQKRMIRGGSRAAATSKIECFVIIVNGLQPLTIITRRSILDVATALDPLLMITASFSFGGVMCHFQVCSWVFPWKWDKFTDYLHWSCWQLSKIKAIIYKGNPHSCKISNVYMKPTFIRRGYTFSKIKGSNHFRLKLLYHRKTIFER